MTENAFTQAEAALVDDIVSRVNVAKSYFLEEPALTHFIEYRIDAEIAANNNYAESRQAVIQLVKKKLNVIS